MHKYYKWIVRVIIASLIIIALYILSLYNYALFHRFDQIFCIVISCAIFSVSMRSVISSLFLKYKNKMSLPILTRENSSIFNNKVHKYLFWSTIFMIIPQVMFLISNDGNKIVNFIGDNLKIFSFYILFKAVVVVRFYEPKQIENNVLDEQIQAVNKYNNLVNSIDEAFCIIEFIYDPSGEPFDYRYVEVNPAFKKHTGIDNALGSRASESAPYKTEKLLEVYSNVATTGVPIRYVFEAEEVNRWFSLYAFKVNNNQKVRVGVLLRDITEEVNARNNMENTIKMQDEIFANISHELKTPLNVIFSTVQLLELYSNNNSLVANRNKVEDGLNIIKQNCYRFTKLINNIVDLSKIDSGFMKYDIENRNIIEVVENIVQSISEFVKENKLNIIFDTDSEEKIVAFDADKIERVMLNLISNAIKFSNEGDTIYVNLSDKDDFVQIEVKDNGVGIEEKYLQSIFERFNQVDKTLYRNVQGTGIGLSLVKSIVDMHGGNISVISELGNGSTFRILLPAITVECCSDDEQKISSKNDKVEMINIEFSDIYKL